MPFVPNEVVTAQGLFLTSQITRSLFDHYLRVNETSSVVPANYKIMRGCCCIKKNLTWIHFPGSLT